jgi:uncharacterized protein YndB with AHSA1/START domain
MDILHRVGIRAAPEKVYNALATRAGLADWWTRDTEGDGGRVGGALKFRFHNPTGAEIGSFDMTVRELQPAARVLWQVTGGPDEWIGTTIRWELKQEEDYTIVRFRHEGWKEAAEFMHHCSTKWALFLMSLKALLETGKGAPSPHDVKIDNWN